MRLLAFLVWMFALFVSQVAKGDEASDHDAVQGTWLPTTAELRGKPFPDDVRKSIKLTIKGDESRRASRCTNARASSISSAFLALIDKVDAGFGTDRHGDELIRPQA